MLSTCTCLLWRLCASASQQLYLSLLSATVLQLAQYGCYAMQARGEAGWAKGASRGRGRGRGDYGRQNFQSVFGGGAGQHSNHHSAFCFAVFRPFRELKPFHYVSSAPFPLHSVASFTSYFCSNPLAVHSCHTSGCFTLHAVLVHTVMINLPVLSLQRLPKVGITRAVAAAVEAEEEGAPRVVAVGGGQLTRRMLSKLGV